MPVTFSYNALTDDQQETVASLWHDGVDPADFRYGINDAGHVISRHLVAAAATRRPALPQPVSSSLKAPKPLTLKQIKHELAFPGEKRKRHALPSIILGALAIAIYEGQRRQIITKGIGQR